MDKEMQQFQDNLMEAVRDMKAGRAACPHLSGVVWQKIYAGNNHMNATLEINSDIKAQLHHLAEETRRSETELANEALSVFLAHDRYIRAKIQKGLAQARHGEFVADSEMEAFFAEYADKAA